MEFDNLTKVCYEIACDLNKNKHLFKYKDFDLYFECDQIKIICDTNIASIYDDGTVMCGQNSFTLPLVLLYMCAHILQNYKKKSMTKYHNINTILAGLVDTELFWMDEYQFADLNDIWVDLHDIHDAIDPGVFVSLNGSTISFTEGLHMINNEHISKDYLMPMRVIKTPHGTSNAQVFSYNQFDICTNFIDEIEHIMMLNHNARRYPEYTNSRINTKTINLKNGSLDANGYILYTRMKDVIFDHENRIFHIIWNIMSTYTD